MNLRTSALSIAAFLCLPVAGMCGATGYTITITPLLGNSMTSINNQGVVTGIRYNSALGKDYAVTWSKTSGVTYLNPLPSGVSSNSANAINDLGQVAGTSGPYGVFWNRPSNPTQFQLPSQYTEMDPYALNDSGQVVGGAFYPGIGAAFSWKNGVLTMLPTLGGIESVAYDINNSGLICGYAERTDVLNGGMPCAWQNGQAIELIQIPGGLGGSAYGVNDLGQLVGYGFTPNALYDHACLWNSFSSAPITLQEFAGTTHSSAQEINNLGQIVGSYGPSGVMRACMWENGVCIDLNSLVPAGFGYTLENAADINDKGQIVGNCTNQYGTFYTFLMEPVPEPSSVLALITGLAGIGGAAIRRRNKH